MRVLIGGRVRWAALIALAGALAVGGVAYAVIPDSNGVIHGCYMKSGGTLRVIDATVTNCKSGETSLNWNQTGPPGPPGQQGLQGTQGPPGTSGYEIVTETEDFESTVSFALLSKTATCPAGKKALGGGGSVLTGDGGVTTGYQVIQSYPLSAGTGWRATFAVTNSIDEPFTVAAYATCANVSP